MNFLALFSKVIPQVSAKISNYAISHKNAILGKTLGMTLVKLSPPQKSAFFLQIYRVFAKIVVKIVVRNENLLMQKKS